MHFPQGFEPNDAQTFILTQIAEGLKEGKTNFIINAPTATGKSFISKTLANASDPAPKKFVEDFNAFYFSPNDMSNYKPWGTAVITCTRALQEQYCQQFPDGNVLMGKDNYDCALDSENPCSLGKCTYVAEQRAMCWKKSICKYQVARQMAHCNKCAFYNYSLFFSLPDKPLVKEWLVFDEASEMEDELVSNYTVELRYKTLNYLLTNVPPTPNKGSSLQSYHVWVSKILAEAKTSLVEALEMLKSCRSKKGTRHEKLKTRYIQLFDLHKKLERLILIWDLTEWFPIHDKESLSFLPYKVDKLFWYQDKVKFSKYRVFMSATIVNHKSFMRTLGLNENDTMYIESPSPLDPAKAPIVGLGNFWASNKNKETVFPQIAAAAVKLAANEQLKGLKGIFHTQNFDMLNCVREASKEDDRYLFRGKGLSNQDILKTHSSTDRPTILVSPSMTHGVDLKGELGEFQVILKAPYPNMGDERIKRKMKDDPEWYRDKMLSTLIQECGRCNRLASDRAITFILDSLAATAIEKNKDILPKYFVQRYIGRKMG